MRPFRSFFFMSLLFFLFLFFARFIILAFIAAGVLSFIAFVVRKIRMVSYDPYWDDDYSNRYYRYQHSLPTSQRYEEPLFFEQEKETEFNWLKDYRTIKVQ